MKRVCLLIVILIFAASAFATDHEIAAEFAPVFFQGLGDKPRSDYITNFDFDGDWRGDNNWLHTDDLRYHLKGYIYYAVSETRTHYFIQYAVFHPRDYKGGETKGLILSELLRQGAQAAGKNDPTGLLDDAAIAHENDMEGALIVAEKSSRRVAYVQTLHHNRFSTYTPENLKMDGQHPQLYVEPKGHGIQAHGEEQKEEARKIIIYRYTGVAGEASESSQDVGYDLLPIATTLWLHARTTPKTVTYGAARDYSQITIQLANAAGKPVDHKVRIGTIGAAFLGRQGGVNMARPPWGWFDLAHREDPPGLWFFDPARVIKRDLKLSETFSTVYVRAPFWAGK